MLEDMLNRMKTDVEDHGDILEGDKGYTPVIKVEMNILNIEYYSAKY